MKQQQHPSITLFVPPYNKSDATDAFASQIEALCVDRSIPELFAAYQVVTRAISKAQVAASKPATKAAPAPAAPPPSTPPAPPPLPIQSTSDSDPFAARRKWKAFEGKTVEVLCEDGWHPATLVGVYTKTFEICYHDNDEVARVHTIREYMSDEDMLAAIQLATERLRLASVPGLNAVINAAARHFRFNPNEREMLQAAFEIQSIEPKVAVLIKLIEPSNLIDFVGEHAAALKPRPKPTKSPQQIKEDTLHMIRLAAEAQKTREQATKVASDTAATSVRGRLIIGTVSERRASELHAAFAADPEGDEYILDVATLSIGDPLLVKDTEEFKVGVVNFVNPNDGIVRIKDDCYTYAVTHGVRLRRASGDHGASLPKAKSATLH